MFGHMANENRNSPWKRCLCLTQTRVNVQSSLIIGMNHRSDGPDYGIVLEDTYVCQRVSEFINSPDEGLVSELTSSIHHGLWKDCDRKLFLRGKKLFSSVHYGGNWKCKGSCYLHVSCPHLSPCYPADTWPSSCTHYGRPIAYFQGAAQSVI